MARYASAISTSEAACRRITPLDSIFVISSGVLDETYVRPLHSPLRQGQVRIVSIRPRPSPDLTLSILQAQRARRGSTRHPCKDGSRGAAPYVAAVRVRRIRVGDATGACVPAVTLARDAS